MKLIGFGDYLIHFSPTDGQRFLQADTMRVSFTGAEANVCAALALWGNRVAFATRLPQHPLAQRGVMFLKSFGIDTRHIACGGKRMGLYFLESGASVRTSQVIYDRSDSGFTEAKPSDFDFGAMLDGCDWLYLTGITPALSPTLFECTLALCSEAKKRGVRVAYDVNYRPALSSPQQAGEVLKKLAPCITCLIGNEEHLKSLLDLASAYGEENRRERLTDIIAGTRSVTGIEQIAVTVRRTPSASDAITYAAYSDGGEPVLSREYHVHVVDRVGSGDAFSAGLLHAFGQDLSAQDAVEFAAASGAFKQTVTNDVNFASEEELLHLMRSNSRDVKR